MASRLIVPFDNDPINVVRGTTALYTVPAGRFAKITLQYDASFALSRSGGITTNVWNGNPAFGVSPNAGEISFWLTSAQTMQLAAANTTGTGTVPTGTDTILNINAIAGFTITIGGVLWKSVQSRAFLVGPHQSNNIGNITFTLTPTVNFGFIAQEYNKIT